MKIVRYDVGNADDGVTLEITPLTPYVTQTILLRLAERVPFDESAYLKAVPNAAVPQTYVDKQDPAYIKEKTRVGALRDHMLIGAMLEAAVTCAKQDELVTLYTPFVERLRNSGIIPEGFSLWSDVIRYCILDTPEHVRDVMKIVRGDAALTEEEVLDGLRYFRMDVQGRSVS